MSENTEKRDRTRAKLKLALIELCDEKPYYDITIWDICNRAESYRSTFYRYYDSKDAMLREIEHEYIEGTCNLTPTLWNFHTDALPKELERYRCELIADMEYHRAHKKICVFLLSPAGDIYFYNKMVESISNSVRRNFQKYSFRRTGNVEYLLNFFATGFISTIYEWLKKDDCSPSEIADFLLSMMMNLY